MDRAGVKTGVIFKGLSYHRDGDVIEIVFYQHFNPCCLSADDNYRRNFGVVHKLLRALRRGGGS